MVINVSRIRDYCNCPRMFYWRWIRRLIIPGVAEPLYYGRIVHDALQAYYMSGDDATRARELAHASIQWARKGETAGIAPGIAEQILDESSRLMHAYFDRYGEEKFAVLLTEQEMFAVLPNGHVLGGRPDGVIAYESSPYLIEHKTIAQFTKTYWAQWRTMLQPTAYVWLTHKAVGLRPKGVLANVLKKTSGGNHDFYRQTFDRDDYQVDAAVKLAVRVTNEIARHGCDMESYRCNYDRCVDYGRTCPYQPLCELGDPRLTEMFEIGEPDYILKKETEIANSNKPV